MERDKSRAITARVVGSTIFLYIATSITGTILFTRVTEGQGIAARLANIAQHSPQMGPLEAVDGMLRFGISTAYIFALMQAYWPMLSRRH